MHKTTMFWLGDWIYALIVKLKNIGGLEDCPAIQQYNPG
jgi:hypothetical protein